MFWDALLAPNNSMLFLYLLGSFQFMKQSNGNYGVALAGRQPNIRSSLIKQRQNKRDHATLNRAVLHNPPDHVWLLPIC